MDNDQMTALMREFGELIGIADLVLDETGSCTFEIDDSELAISIVHEEDGGLTLMAALPEIALDEAVLLSLLQANFLGGLAAGAVFSIDPATDAVVLVRPMGDGVEPQALAESMQGLIDVAETWQAELEENSAELESAEAPAERPLGHGLEPGIRV